MFSPYKSFVIKYTAKNRKKQILIKKTFSEAFSEAFCRKKRIVNENCLTTTAGNSILYMLRKINELSEKEK